MAKLSPEQIANSNLTNVADNGSFEALACDPANGKLYIGNEESPMLIWSVDYVTGKYEVLIDVQRRPDWTSKIVEISGMTYDPIGKMLYVLSAASRVILQSTQNGTLIGSPLNVSEVGDPGGLSYEPTTGDLIVFGEPRQVARYSQRAATKAPTKAPVPVPIQAPVPVPILLPAKTPTKAPLQAPANALTKAPTGAPTKKPVKAPTRNDCGLFGLNIFCPFTFCGVFGRLLRLCKN